MAIPKKKKKDVLISLKMSEQERKALQQMADKYADGNLSNWLRKAGMQFKPKKVAKV